MTSALAALQGWPGIALVVVLLLAFFVSVQKRLKRLETAAKLAANPSLAALSKMTWKQFELLVHQAFRHRGYVVGESGAVSPDGSVDMVLRKAGEYFLVHSQQWKSTRIDVVSVRELHNAMRARRAAGGFMVTTGNYSREAMAFASGRSIQLIDGPTLREMLNDTAGIPTGVPTVITVGEPSVTTTVSADAPACPICKSAMVLGMGAATAAGARGGENALAKNVWRCSRFPACQGTRDAA